MATLQSIEDLKDYCLRRLGEPVINIEIDPVQAYERIEDAIAFFVERHFNGTEEVYFKYTMKHTDVENGYITMPKEYVALLDVLSSSKSSSGEPQWDYQQRFMKDLNDKMIGSNNGGTLSEYYLSMSHLDMMNNLLTPTRAFLYNSVSNHLHPKWKMTDVGSANFFKGATDISGTDWTTTNSVATGNDAADPFGKNQADTLTSSAAGLFSLKQVVGNGQYVRGTYTTAFSIKKGTYNGNLTLKVEDSQGTLVHSQVITPTNLWNKDFITFTYTAAHADNISITIEGNATGSGETIFIFNPWLYANNILVFHGYKIIDAGQSLNVYDDRWVKSYATAMVKQQWGSNLKKFDGVQMPGGVTLNGQTIYDEAVTEIDGLMETFSMDYEEQPTGMWA